jgi:hypothetical protein
MIVFLFSHTIQIRFTYDGFGSYGSAQLVAFEGLDIAVKGALSEVGMNAIQVRRHVTRSESSKTSQLKKHLVKLGLMIEF